MRFPNAFLDDIRNRLRISEVVGTRVQFDKRKSNPSRGDYWACCPFHGEKTPSFHCEDSKGRYYCFGCGASGDHFRFLTELDGMGFTEAVEIVSAQAGLAVPVMDARQIEQEQKRGTLFDVMQIANQWFQEQLQSSNGAQARAYLRDRGLNGQTQQKFGIGYAPESKNALKQFLADKGIGKDQIQASGMVVFGPDIPVSYDRFRNRIMFPIPDSKGRPIAFGGRALAPDAMAKYLNSPETELFHKSNVLYNYANARKSVYEQGQVLVVEGYMDVIGLDAAGIHNAIAPMGTALTERQMALLWRMQDEPVLCFDGDGAGLRAAFRAIDLILPHLQPGKSARFVLLPEGKDPDDIVRQSGASAMQEYIDQALPLVELIWQRELQQSKLDTPENKAQFEQRLFRLTQTVTHEGVRHHYRQHIKEKLSQLFASQSNARPTAQLAREGMRKRFSNRQPPKGRKNSPRAGMAIQSSSASTSLVNSALVKNNTKMPSLREAVLLGGVVFHPALCALFFDEFSTLDLQHHGLSNLHQVMVDVFSDYGAQENWPQRETVRQRLDALGLFDIVNQLERQLKASGIWEMLDDAAFEDAVDGWKQAYALHLKNRTLHKELKAAEQALADHNSEDNLNRLLSIRRELERGDGTEALIEGFGLSSGRSR